MATKESKILNKVVCENLVDLIRLHVKDCPDCKVKNITKELPIIGMIVSQKDIDAFLKGE